MVLSLVLVLVAAVLQLTLALYVRNVVVDAAGEGARLGALEGGTAQDAIERTRALIGISLDEHYIGDVSASRIERDGLALLRVHVVAPLPVVGLLGPTGGLAVDGHALLEPGAGGTP